MLQAVNGLAETWWAWMGPMFWQAAFVVFLVAGIDVVSRRRLWPGLRYALWLLILAKLVLPPTFSLPTSATSGFQRLVGPGKNAAPSRAVSSEGLLVAQTSPEKEPMVPAAPDGLTLMPDGGRSAPELTAPMASNGGLAASTHRSETGARSARSSPKSFLMVGWVAAALEPALSSQYHSALDADAARPRKWIPEQGRIPLHMATENLSRGVDRPRGACFGSALITSVLATVTACFDPRSYRGWLAEIPAEAWAGGHGGGLLSWFSSRLPGAGVLAPLSSLRMSMARAE